MWTMFQEQQTSERSHYSNLTMPALTIDTSVASQPEYLFRKPKLTWSGQRSRRRKRDSYPYARGRPAVLVEKAGRGLGKSLRIDLEGATR